MSFLLDTDICSTHLKQKGNLTHKFLQHMGRLHVSVITLGELYSWALRAKAPPPRLQSLLDLLNDVQLLEVTEPVARQFGDVRAALLDAGKPVPEMDLMIAARAAMPFGTYVALRWEDDVNWEHDRIHVTSPKTEHHTGGKSRVIPLFPELRRYLEDCHEFAHKRDEYVITRYRDTNSNLRTQLIRIIMRAGLKPWPRLFHNLRSSRQTELEEKFPSHVVCAWIGNSPQVARRHYLQVTDEFFGRTISASRLRAGT